MWIQHHKQKITAHKIKQNNRPQKQTKQPPQKQTKNRHKNKQKTVYYLMRKNSVVVYMLLLAIGFANWDTIIAKYNFAHADKAYIHLSFLSKLSDKALPYLVQPTDKLEQVKQDQDLNYGQDKYALSPKDYAERIDNRIEEFVNSYPERDWLEWNYADWHAYKLLEAR